ncbi:carboxypeptidase-like regulatory domain-containing protein [Corallococcus sp. AB011P]|uniref:carboxypeptidase-like regulatory domain-containing protein n=1 Tax=Corallococcus sp. AB011P TaxID=2316735 RepID=UPI001F324132|nr:carboxypeptidase-like regulatory domain-containing protein [Corallococcus sp. AB011P]
MGLLAVVLACAGTPRPVVETPGPAEDVAWMFRVVDPDGHPVSGARVSVWRADHPPTYNVRSGTTDAQGTGHLLLKPGWYAAEVQARGFVTAFRTDIRLAPESKLALDVSLTRSAPLSGRVVDVEGKPVPDVRLRFASSNVAAPFVEATSDAQGQFHFEGAAAGEGLLYVDKWEWSPQRLKTLTPQPELTVVMGRLSSLLVRVVDPEGHPLPKARSYVTPLEGRLGVAYEIKRTPDGLLHQQLPAQRYSVTGHYNPAPGCWWGRSVDVDVLPGKHAEVTVSFEGVAITSPWTGRAVTPDGQPLAGLSLFATSTPSPAGMRTGGFCETTTGPDGRFEWMQSLAWPYTLKIRTRDSREQVGEAEQAPSDMKDGPLVFHSPGALVGRVLGPDGKPLPRFDVDWTSNANPEGRFFRRLDASRAYSLIASAPNLAPTRVRVEGRAHEVRTVPDITLDAGHPVVGQVFEEDGRTPVPEAGVELVDPADVDIRRSPSPYELPADMAGRFKFDHVPRRRQYLRVNDKKAGTLLYELGPREDRVDLTLKPDGALEGFVTDGARVPLAGVKVEVRCEAGLDARTETDEAGHYVLRVPADRECFVHVSEADLRDAPWPRPPPLVFAPQAVSLSPRERERRDFVPRSAGASLRIGFPEPRERLEPFLVPGDARMPKNFAELKALQRSAFSYDPPAFSWRSNDPDLPGYQFLQKNFAFSHLPRKRYTLFVVEPQDTAFAVLLVPVDLTREETTSLPLGFPLERGGMLLVE